jgi:hypothetical protein
MVEQKLYAYVDDFGQDTYGEVYLVSVVVTGETRDAARQALQGIERGSGKRLGKWRRSRVMDASFSRSQASFSAKFTPRWHSKHRSGLHKQYVAPYSSFSALGPSMKHRRR